MDPKEKINLWGNGTSYGYEILHGAKEIGIKLFFSEKIKFLASIIAFIPNISWNKM